MNRTVPGLGLLALLGLLSGCSASFRAHRLERVASGWPPGLPEDAARLRSLGIAFHAATREDGREVPLAPHRGILYRNATHWAYRRAERFTHVRSAPELADLSVDVRLTGKHAASPLGLRVAHALTFGLIPAWERQEWTLVTTVTAQDGKQLGRFERSEAVNTWHQLLLTLVYPFAPPPGVAADCVFDLNRATIAEAVAAGIL
ncbi:MAG TPA: hypothetical protein VNE39_29500 [Planctomycetota bacterium]|nr:hypothetical protein [Planctomycetota bacterium]